MAAKLYDLLEKDEFAGAFIERRRRLQQHTGGGGNGGGDMWQQSIEGRLEGLRQDMRADFRTLCRWYGTGVLVVVSMIIASYLLLDVRMRGIEAGIQDIGNGIRAITERISAK